MAVLIESSVWEPSPALYIFIFLCCFFSVSLFPRVSKSSNNSNRISSVLDNGSFPSLLRFRCNFLLLYSLASVMEGLWSVFGEFELAHHGVTKEQMAFSICVGLAAALFLGPFFGVLSDLTGQKKVCLAFCILHVFVGVWKKISAHPSFLLTSICLSLATSIFVFIFETWVVVENEKQGHRQDSLSDTFWLMIFFESASLIASQVLVNWLIGSNLQKGIASTSNAAIFFALIGIICVSRWAQTPHTPTIQEYKMSFSAYIFHDKRMWLLVCTQACLQFSIVVFWILWAPTVVADGREVHLGLIYSCLLGARMLGSTAFPWLINGPALLRTEDCLVYAFITLGLVLSIVAYDYQEVGVLVSLFCIFHTGVGLVIPSLARLKSMYVPNELRGGVISLSLTMANAALLFFLMQRGYHQSIENATMMAFAAIGLFTAAGCMHLLKRCGKQPYQNWHKL
ncbi:molybdate-anion transporter [Tripterygium wilfordii]|uniref:Molybdate-anion transporter n=1 Tax=Tripterygium wilfordii TaxID=458696 RepID=A0A7J7E2S6_TRIWF|nr:molybdate-anion transporter-like [Tripterygium wilfordii]KAF5752849.1 molybdate-anion transporter [Tripterygium wilfordii]